MAARLSAEHRRYIGGETLVAVVINALLSLAFALLTSHGVAVVPLWGVHGMALDFAPQVFMVTFATTLAITLVARARVRSGKAAPLGRERGGLLAWGSRNAFLRAVIFGLTATLILAPISAGALYELGRDSLLSQQFIIMKVVYGALLAAVIAPSIARAALTLS